MVIGFLLLIGGLTTSAEAAQSHLEGELDTVLREEGLVGIAWGLLDGGGVRVGAQGLRDNDADLAFTPDTRFHVGSVAKSVLASGLLRLATTGRVELDAPVNQYLPDHLSVLVSDEGTAVTIRHLLDHTAGIDDARLWQLFSEQVTEHTPLLRSFPNPRSLLRIRAQPGARFSYSNMGYTLLGVVIETVTGERYEKYLDHHLLAPLGMSNSTFAYTTQVGSDADVSLAWGHVDDGSRYPAAPVYLRPAGQFTSTAGDMLRFAQFAMGDGRIGDEVFIDSEFMRSRGQPVGTEAAHAGLIAGYALGLGRRDRHGVVGYCHGGNIVGFAAMLCMFPEDDKAFIYSINTDSETADYDRIQRALIAALDIQVVESSSPVALAGNLAGWMGWYVVNPNRFSTFEYLDTVFGAIHLAEDEGKLAMTGIQQELRWLLPVGGDLYSAADRRTASHVLLRGSQSEHLLSDGFKTFEKVSPMLLIAYWVSLLLGVIGLAWLALVGLFTLIRGCSSFLLQPVAPAFATILLLLLPVPLFLGQSFMAMGDKTVASVMLALVTACVPFAMLWTVLRVVRLDTESSWQRLHGIAALLVLQWCLVLWYWHLLPLRLWL